MPGNHADRVARYVQAAEALEVLQGRVRENTGEVGNLLFDRWTADDLHELACLARAERIGQNRVAAGKPRDSHNPGQIYCEESFGEDEATEKTPWHKARASASKPETSASSSGDDHSLLMQLMAKIETLEASQQSLAREPRTGAQARQEEASEKRPEEAGRAAGASTRREGLVYGDARAVRG